MKTITGGCACGAIRYEVTAEPIVTFNCHCRDCQKTTGGAYASCFLRFGERVQDYQGHAEIFRHNQRNDGRQCARFLSGMRFAIVWGQVRFRTRHRCWDFG